MVRGGRLCQSIYTLKKKQETRFSPAKARGSLQSILQIAGKEKVQADQTATV